MVTPRSGRPRGRRPKTFREDPDRHAVARLAIGREIAPLTPISPNYPELVVTHWEKVCAPGAPATFEGKADTLEKKRKKWRSDPAREPWLQAMVAAFVAVFQEHDRAKARARCLWLASRAGEAAFARRVLWPMITARDLPEFRPHHDRSIVC
jgi:hypothetical protein